MSKRPFDTNQNKMSKTDRFVQMSQQEMLIEQKKREIQAKLEAKRRQNLLEAKEKEAKTVTEQVVVVAPSIPGKNQFSNDGSFLNQFKQLKEKKKDTKFKTFNKYKEREKEKEKEKVQDKEKEKDDSSEDKSQNKEKKSSTPRKRSPSPVDHHRKQSRYSADRVPSFEPQKITFNTSFSNASNFSTDQPSSNPEAPLPDPAIEQPDDAEMGPLPSTTQTTSVTSESVPAAATVDVAPPQTTFTTDIINFSSQSQIITIAPPIDQNLGTAPQLVTTTVTQPLAPPPGIPPIIQQSVSIIDTTGQDLATSTQDLGQLGAPNLSSTAPSLQQPEPMITQTLSAPSQIFATTGAEHIISGSSQMLMSVPPPQIMQQTQLILTPQTQSVLVSTPTSILTTVTLPPPVISAQNINVTPQNNLNLRSTGLTTVELTSIPPPNPIQVQNIPQPEPLNTLNIPPPAPLQVQNIPTPSSLQLNEIPNPKPLDLMAIPTPNEEEDVTDSDFIKNIPPPNRSVPPPNLSEVTSVPPPNSMNFLSNPPPRIHHNGPPGGQMQVSGPSMSQAPPPQPSTSRIPSLMSQPVLPPPGMGVNVPPPLLPLPPTRDVSQPPPNFLSQAPPPLPNLTVPPPMIGGVGGPPPPRGGFKDQIAGGAEFEAMANLARMVAECGPSVEDVVRQKKNRDPDLWFLFHKESSAYRQYANLVEQYKKEKEEADKLAKTESNHDPSEDYDPEMALEDYDDGEEFKPDFDQGEEFNQDYDSRDEFKQDYDSGDQFKQDYDSRDQFKQDYDSRDQFKHDYDGRNQYKQDYDSRDKFKKDYDSRTQFKQDSRDKFKKDYDSSDQFKQDYDSRTQFKQDYDSRDNFKKDYDNSDQFKQDYDSRDRFKQDYDSRDEFKQDYDDRMEFKQDFANRAEIKQDYDQREEFKQDFKQGVKQEHEFSPSSSSFTESASARRERKRKSRWGEKDPNVKPPVAIPVVIPTIGAAIPPVPGSSSMLSKVTRSDPGLIQYAMQTYGSANLSEEDWKKTEDNYKIHLLYQDMMRRKEELKKLQMQGRNKYEYDSDEDTDGGTWEHKLRIKEMQATERWAHELTRQAEGKHHIGDFLPPEELDRFLEKSNAVKEGRQPNFSDYKEFKIKEDNIGFQMLQKLGWSEGQGLGQQGSGIVEPINKGAPRENTQGLGLNLGEATEGEDEYESYRKRMMLAYRFRPNPLNNPRRPYY